MSTFARFTASAACRSSTRTYETVESAFSNTVRASSSRSSPMTSGGRKRKTLPKVPQVSRARHGVAAVGAAEAACLDRVHNLGAAGDPGQRQSAGDALGRRDQIGDDPFVVTGKPVAGAAETGLDLVGDEDDAVVAAP